MVFKYFLYLCKINKKIMEKLKQRFYEKYAFTNMSVIRNFSNNIDWSDRLIGIKGSRGVGKTTLILQHIKKNYKPDNSVLYVSLDNLYFTENKLYDLAEEFYKKGGILLTVDEVHRYPNWAIEIKNIYDDFPKLKLFFTGSSLLHIQKTKADLSRRAVIYEMPGLSFREFLTFEIKKKLPIFTFEEILKNHVSITVKLIQQFKPLKYFSDYLDYGYYPFYLENKKTFHKRLSATIQTVLEIDIPQFEQIQTQNIIYLKKLLQIISNSAPFKPNMTKLSQRTGISLNTLKKYIKAIDDAGLLSQLLFDSSAVNNISKPEKFYLENTNLMMNLVGNTSNIGNLRETFFFNQLSKKEKITASKQTDFVVNNKYSFEIGGKNKSKHQIKDINNSYVVKDDIEIGSDNVIPLWLFGFMY